jgi:hypothetical protein
MKSNDICYINSNLEDMLKSIKEKMSKMLLRDVEVQENRLSFIAYEQEVNDFNKEKENDLLVIGELNAKVNKLKHELSKYKVRDVKFGGKK